MSQIILKFQEGGTTPTLFKWNLGGIETDRLIKAISANIDSYLDEQDWSVKRKERFVNSVNKFITGIENGNITEMSPTGKFLDSRGIEGGGVSNETGNNRFREDREAASFVKWVLNGQTPYQKPEKKKAEPFDINKSFAKSFNKKYLNNTSDTFNLEALSNVSYNHRNNLIYPIFEALRNVESEDWGDYGNKQNYLAAVKSASDQYEKARKAGFKDDVDAAKTIISSLSGLNINSGFLKSWFSTVDGLFSNPSLTQALSTTNDTTNTTTDTSTTLTTEESPSTPTNTTTDTSYESLLFYPEIQNLWKIDQKTNIRLPANRWINSSGYEQHIGPLFTNTNNYLAKLFLRVVRLDSKNWSNFAPSEYQVPDWDPKTATWKINYATTYKELMGDAINYMLQRNSSDLLKLNDGSVVIGSTINVNYPVCLAYNPSTKELKRVPIYLLMNEPNVGPKIKEQLANSSITTNIPTTSIWSHKEGGSIKKYQTPAGPLDFDWDKYNEFIKWDGTKRYKNDKSNGTWGLIDRTEDAKDDNSNGFYRTEGDSVSLETEPYFQQYLNYGLLNDKAKTSDGNSLAETWARNYVKLNPKYGDEYKNAWFKDDVFNFDAFKNSKFYQGYAKVDNNKGKFLWGDGLNGIGHDVYKGKIYHIVNDKGENEFNTKEYFEGLGYYLPEDAKEEYFNNNPIVSYQTLIKKKPESKTPETEEKLNSSVDPMIHSDKGLDFDWESWAIPFAGSTLRYLNTERANKQMLDEALNSYKPYYKDPKRFERNVYGDYAALSNAENEAQQINVKASNPTYSDALIQAAKELEGEKAATSKRAEGQRAYSNKILTTQEATLAQAKENDYNAIDTTNENRYNRWNTNMLKSQARQGYISRRALNLNTFLLELQMQAQNRFDKKLNLDEKALEAYIKAKYSNNPELLALLRDAQLWVAQGNDLSTWDNAKYNRLISLLNKLAYEEMKFRLENTGKLYGIGVNKRLLNKIKVNSNPIQVNLGSVLSNKSGGTLSEENKMKISKMKHLLEKLKLFLKNIRESINDNSKMINNLSNTMLKLLMQVIK